MLALVIVADGDQEAFMATFQSLLEHQPMGEFDPKVIVDASGDPDHAAWLKAHFGVFQVVDLQDYPTRPSHVELRIPAGALVDDLQVVVQ